MRNLKIKYCRNHILDLKDIKCLLFDVNGNTKSEKYFAVTENKLYYCNEIGVSSCMVELPAKIVSAEYLALECQVCLATDLGEVVIVDPMTLAQSEGTFCEVGIESMSWSPDQEVVVFITKEHKIVVMTCTYDVIVEHALVDDVDPKEQFVNVGWGKKETQFHGSEGKQAAKQTSTFKPPENVQNLPQNINVTWRADGAYFAVSFVSEQVGRMFKVYDKEGNLQYVSEKVNDLEPQIAWRPTGTWIAVPQRFPNKSTIALFEKNGLRHREIVLQFDLAKECIVNVKWSSDSEVLAIHTKHSIDNWEKIYLYTIGNYHWYLKQVLYFTAAEYVTYFTWDTRIGEEKSLHIVQGNGNYYCYSWYFAVDKYVDTGVVCVIDGRKLLVSYFDKSVVPPPMCNYQIELEANINACIFVIHNSFYLCDEYNYLHLFEYNIEKDKFERECSIGPGATGTVPWYQFELLPELIPNYDLLIVAVPTRHNSSHIVLYALDYTKESAFYTYRELATVHMKDIVCGITLGDTLSCECYAQTVDGQMYHIERDLQKFVLTAEKLNINLGQIAQHMECYSKTDPDQDFLVSLTNKQCLYLDAERIADDVTSFFIFEDYLAYTKLCSLHFYNLIKLTNISERKLERGGKLVTIVDGRTVLQMPRGNLEAIYPRVLSLNIMGKLLDEEAYDEALDMVRKQRINMNILCDHNTKRFVEEIDIFLEKITNPNWLNLFLIELQNEDFSKTMYASSYDAASQQYPVDFRIENKIEYLCKVLCKRMQESKNEIYRLPIITSYVKLGEIETALLTVWQEVQKASEAGKTMDDALNYLIYLVDVNELYKVALGTYDFNLVLYVAEKTQKDPKEYIPFLNELNAMELNYQHFKIDEHLQRNERALEHIAKCGIQKFEESLEFIKRHGLYHKALECYKTNVQCYKQICLAFGDYLRGAGRLEMASVMYERGGNLGQALLSAKNVLDWQRVLLLAKKDKQDLKAVALSMLPALQENGKYMEAYELLKACSADINDILACLIKGKLFLKALFEASIHGGTEATVKDALLNYCTVLESTFGGDRCIFNTYKQRLLEIRKERAKQKLEGYSSSNQVDIDEGDLISDTTSMRSSQYTASSRGTGKTFRSAKNRRKHERKVLSLKPGNPFEEIALINAVYNQINTLTSQQQHISDTCKALLELNEDVLATKIQQLYKNFLKLIQDSLDDIWIPEMQQTQPFVTGPNIDYTQLQQEQRYAMIEPHKRFKPQLNLIDWEHELLK